MSVLSQCPGKRAGHCYGICEFFKGDRGTYLNALESGRGIVTTNAVDGSGNQYTISMPWKAGGALLQTPFWRPVALGLVSPESLTPSPDPLRNQNKEFATPFREAVYLPHAALISLILPHPLKSLTSIGLSAFVRPA